MFLLIRHFGNLTGAHRSFGSMKISREKSMLKRQVLKQMVYVSRSHVVNLRICKIGHRYVVQYFHLIGLSNRY